MPAASSAHRTASFETPTPKSALASVLRLCPKEARTTRKNMRSSLVSTGGALRFRQAMTADATSGAGMKERGATSRTMRGSVWYCTATESAP